MRPSSQRVAAVRPAGDLRRVEGHRHQRRTAPRAVLAGVEAFAAQGVRRLDEESFGFKVALPAAARLREKGRRDVNAAAGAVAAEGQQVAGI
jgi:hypothetical protein